MNLLSKKNIFLGTLVVLVAVYIIFSVYITTLSIKATRKIPENTPSELGMVYRDINFQTSDGINLEGWYVDNKKNELVILIHGVDSNKSDGKMLDIAKDIYDMGYKVMSFDLRAHGNSGGENLGLTYVERDDLYSSIMFAKSELKIEEIVIYGTSYGATIAVSNALMDDSIKGVILDSPFYDLPELLVSEVSNRTFIPPFIANLLKFGIIQSIKFLYQIETNKILDRIHTIENFNSPVLMFHCEADDRIPISHSERISRYLPDNSKFVIFDNCEHAQAYEKNTISFQNEIKDYLQTSFN